MTHPVIIIIVPRVRRGVEVGLREAEWRQHRVAPTSHVVVPSCPAGMARVDGEGGGCGREDGHHGGRGPDVAEGGAQVEAAAQQVVAAPAAPVGVGVHKLSGRRLGQSKEHPIM